MKNRAIGHVKKLADGKYLLRLSAGFDDYGARLQPSKVVYCKNDKEAEVELMKFYVEKDKLLEDRMNAGPERLNQLYDEWIKNHVSQKAVQTQSFYESLWENHIKDKSKIKLKTILPKHIYDILNEVEGDRTKQAVYKMLKALLNKGVQWGYLESNPCDKVESPKYETEEKRGLTLDELEIIFDALPSQELKYQAATLFALLCGLRRQEVIGLKWDNIDFKNDKFYVKQAAVSKKGEGTIEGKTKTKKSKRDLKLPQELKPILKQLQKEQRIHRLKIGDKWIGEDWIFTQWNGNLLNLTTISAWWHDFMEELGIKGVTFHGLRHTAASYLIKGGTDIVTVAKILGHAKASTSMNFYGHLIEDAKSVALEALENTLIKKNKKSVQ